MTVCFLIILVSSVSTKSKPKETYAQSIDRRIGEMGNKCRKLYSTASLDYARCVDAELRKGI